MYLNMNCSCTKKESGPFPNTIDDRNSQRLILSYFKNMYILVFNFGNHSS